jgi:hypothetical protein
LPLGLEALQHPIVVNPDLDEFQRDLAPNRLVLLRQPHLSHAAFADLFDQAVRPDRCQIASGRSLYCWVRQGRIGVTSYRHCGFDYSLGSWRIEGRGGIVTVIQTSASPSWPDRTPVQELYEVCDAQIGLADDVSAHVQSASYLHRILRSKK